MERALPGPDASVAHSGSALLHAVGRCALRLRLSRALTAAAITGTLGALAVAATNGLHALTVPVPRAAVLWVVLVLVGCASLLAATARVARIALAKRIDRSLSQPSLCASAIELLARPSSTLTAFERVCIARAEQVAREADPRAALPIRVPKATPWLFLAIFGAVLSFSLSPPAHLPLATHATEAKRPPRLLHAEELSAFQEEHEDTLATAALDAAAYDVALELHALLEALADRAIGHEAALARLRELERKLDAAGPLDEHALSAALAQVGHELSRSKESAEVGRSLQAGDSQKAAQAMQALADELERETLPERRRAALAKTLERAAQAPKQGASQEQLRSELERLEREQAKASRGDGQNGPRPGVAPSRPKSRELERLSRQAQREQQAERSLDPLRSELQRAASQLGKDERQAEQALRDAQRELERMAQQRQAAQGSRELTERLAQIRAALGQQRAGKKQDRGAEGRGQQENRAAVLDLDHFARLSRGQPAQDAQDGQPGESPSNASQSEPRASPSVSPSGAAPSGQAPGQESSQGKREGSPGDGTTAGLGGRPGTGQATRLQANHETQRISGQDGQGPTRSEVILEAGQRGFASRSYQKVHAEYARHAESVLERERIPSGYRFYVKRYFQMIRPRSEEAP